ncbi:hypothetical protein Tco_1349969, partial [Tanacetum coccineum]
MTPRKEGQYISASCGIDWHNLSIASLTVGQQYYTGETCRRMWYDGPDPTGHMLKGTSEGSRLELVVSLNFRIISAVTTLL